MHIFLHFDIDIRYLKNIPDIFLITITVIKFYNSIHLLYPIFKTLLPHLTPPPLPLSLNRQTTPPHPPNKNPQPGTNPPPSA